MECGAHKRRTLHLAQCILEKGLGVDAIHTRDIIKGNLFWTGCLARTCIGAIAETLLIHLSDHIEDTVIGFNLTLW